MKDKQKKLTGFALVCGLILAMVGCTPDDDGGENTPQPPITNTKADVSYSVTLGADELSVFDVEIAFINDKGDTEKEKAQNPSWEKNFTDVPLPLTVELTLSYTKKTPYTDKETYNLGHNYAVTVQTAAGGILFMKDSSGSFSSYPKAQIEQYQTSRDGKSYGVDEQQVAP
jgi:hypothetical protein